MFKKASYRLHKELDITTMLKSIRYTRNMFKYLTTLRERVLVKLQAHHNVFDLGLLNE
jgi:hypothetical protein